MLFYSILALLFKLVGLTFKLEHFYSSLSSTSSLIILEQASQTPSCNSPVLTGSSTSKHMFNKQSISIHAISLQSIQAFLGKLTSSFSRPCTSAHYCLKLY